MADDKIKSLYQTFVNEGYEMEPESEFRVNLGDVKKRRAAYDALVSDGYEMESYEEFERNIGYSDASALAAQAVGRGGNNQASSTRLNTHEQDASKPWEFPLDEYDDIVTEKEDALAGDYIPPSDPRWNAQIGGRQTKEQFLRAADSIHNELANKESRLADDVQSSNGEATEVTAPEPENGSSLIPSEKDKIAFIHELGQQQNAFKGRMRKAMDNVSRMSANYTPEGRRQSQAMEQYTRGRGVDSTLMGLNMSKAEGGEAKDVKDEADKRRDVYYTEPKINRLVTDEEGNQQIEWLMPDGSLTTDKMLAERTAGNARLSKGMRDAGFDPSDTSQIPAYRQWNVERNIDKDIDRAVNKAHEQEKDVYNERVKDVTYDPYGSVHKAAGEEAKKVHDLDKTTREIVAHINDSQKNDLGIDSDEKLYAYVYSRVLNNYKERYKPKSNTEYFWSTVTDNNLLTVLSTLNEPGDLHYAKMLGNEEYGKDHRILNITGTVTGMALDPTTWMAGSVGTMVANKASRLMGKAVMNNVSGAVAGRALSGRVIPMVAKGAAGGAGNFATYEMLKDAEQQLYIGGVVDPDTGMIGDYSASHILGQGVHGAWLGSITGGAGAYLGNVADKVVKGTESVAGKLGVRSGEVVASTVLDGTIFSIPEWIDSERAPMDVWWDNTTMMLGFKVQHGLKSAVSVLSDLGSSSRRKGETLSEIVSRRLTQSPSDMGLSRDDVTELREKGYGSLAELLRGTGKDSKKEKHDMDDNGHVDFKEDLEGFGQLIALMEDASVSQAVRAKLYWAATGRRLPVATIVGVRETELPDGKIRIESLSGNGEVITSRVYNDKESAGRERRAIQRQAELNHIEVGERYATRRSEMEPYVASMEELAELYGTTAENMSNVVEKLLREEERGETLSELERGILENYNSALERYGSAGKGHSPEYIAHDIKERSGIDVEDVLRIKDSRKRTTEEQAALNEYMERLYEGVGANKSEAERGEGNTSSVAGMLTDNKGNIDPTEDRVNKQSGEIEVATLTDGREVYVLDGSVAVHSDGNINRGGSSNAIVVIDAQTGKKEFISADRISAIRKGEEAEDGSLMVGDRVVLPDEEGRLTECTILTRSDDGLMTIEWPDGLREQVSEDELRAAMELVKDEELGDRDEELNDKNSDSPLEQDDIIAIGTSDFGPVFDQFKGKPDEAIAVLSALKNGEAIGALSHPEVGDIDLVWGEEGTGRSDGFGLAKLLKYHPEVVQNLQEILNDMHVTKRTENRINLESDTHKAAVRLTWNNESKKWLLTAFEKKETSEPFDKTTGTDENLKDMQGDTALPHDSDVSVDKDSESLANVQTESPATLIEQLPKDVNGAPDFASAEPRMAWQALVELTDGDREMAKNNASMTREALQKEIEVAKKKEPTLKAVKPSTNPIVNLQKQKDAKKEYEEAMASHVARLEELERQAQAWKRIEQEADAEAIELRAAMERQKQENLNREIEDAQTRHRAAMAEREEKETEQSDRGPYQPHPSIKERWDSSPKIAGPSTFITLADGTMVPGRFVYHEAMAVTPSHDPLNGFRMSEGTPVTPEGVSVNPRQYDRDKDASGFTEAISMDYDARGIRDDKVVQDGNTLSGNGGQMARQLAALRGTDGKYVEALTIKAQQEGIDMEAFGRLEHPDRSFVPDEKFPYTPEVYDIFNRDQRKTMSRDEQAVRHGMTVSEESFAEIERIIGSFDTLGDFYRNNEATNRVLGLLRDGGVIKDNEMAQYRNGEELSGAGEDLIENIIIGKIFDDNAEAIRQLSEFKKMRESVITAINEIAANRTLEEGYRLTAEITKAVDLATKAKKAMPDIYDYGSAVSEFGRQQGLFDDEMGTSAVTDATVLLLADVLNSRSTTELRKILSLYNRQATEASAGQYDIFLGAPRSKEEILKDVNEYFRNATRKEQRQTEREAIAARTGDKRRAETTEQTSVVTGGEETSGEGRRESERFGSKPALDNNRRRIEARREEIRNQLGDRYLLSDEEANNGEVFYADKTGNTNLAVIPNEIFEKIGLKPLPFKLTETMAWHVFSNHAKELKLNSISDAIDFVLDVINNVDHVREGEGSFIFSVENGRKNSAKRSVAIVINTENGEFLGIKTTGYDQIKSLKRRRLLWEKGALSSPEDVATPTVTTIKAQQGDEHVGSAEGQSRSSAGKDTTENIEKQEGSEEVTSDIHRKMDAFDQAQQELDDLEEQLYFDEENDIDEQVERDRRREARQRAFQEMAQEIGRLTPVQLREIADNNLQLWEKIDRVVSANAYDETYGAMMREQRDRMSTINHAKELEEHWERAVETAPLTGKPSSRKIKLKDFSKKAEKNEKQAPLTGIHHDAVTGMAVATDTHILMGDKKAYDENLKGKTITADGKEIEGNYPPVERVIPKSNPIAEYILTSAGVKGMAARLQDSLKGLPKKEADEKVVVVRFPDGTLGSYNARNLAKMLDGMDYLELSNLAYYGQNRPIVSQGGRGLVMLMPAVPQEENLRLDMKQWKGGKESAPRLQWINPKAKEAIDSDFLNELLNPKALSRFENAMDLKAYLERCGLTWERSDYPKIREHFDAMRRGEISPEGFVGVFTGNASKANEPRFSIGNESVYENIKNGIKALERLRNGEEEVTDAMTRKGLSEFGGTDHIAFVFGRPGDSAKNFKGGFGISHIGAKHGNDALVQMLDVIANGQIERFVEGNKTVVLTNGDYEAVLSLTKNGQKQTWLLTGWDKIPTDENGKVSTSTVPTQTNPTFSREDLGAVVESATKLLNEQDINKYNSDAREAFVQLLDGAGVPVEVVDQKQAREIFGHELPDGRRVSGFVKDGKIYLTNDAVTPETPLHEYTHLWDDMVRRENPELWARGKELMKETPLWDEVRNDPAYADIRDNEDAVASEVHSRLSGEEGRRYMGELLEEASKGNIDEQMRKLSLYEKLRTWLGDMFKTLKATLGRWTGRDLKKLTLEEFNRMPLRDLVEGLNPSHGDRTLAGYHNISEEKLKKAMNKGGLANPSMAVIDVNRQTHDGFGAITLVAPKSLVEKRSGRNAGTWVGDAWTPMYPRVERQYAKGKGWETFNKDVELLPEPIKESIKESWSSYMHTGDKMRLAPWFLLDKGIEPIVKEPQYKYPQGLREEVGEFVFTEDGDGGRRLRNLYHLDKGTAERLVDLYVTNELGGDRNAYNEIMNALLEKYAPENDIKGLRSKYGERVRKLAEVGMIPAVMTWAENVGKDHMREPSVDFYETIKQRGLVKELENWVEQRREKYGVEDRLFAGYTPSGAPRYLADTPDNASKIMKEQGRNAANSWGGSFVGFVAGIMQNVNTHEKMRAQKDRLTSNHDDIEKFDKKWGDIYFDLSMKCQPDSKNIGDTYGFYRLDEAALHPDPSAYLKSQYGIDLSMEDNMKLTAMLDAIKNNRPAMYFETKFERPVELSEFEAAVVPKEVDEEIVKGLEDAGLKVFRYDPAKTGDRRRVQLEASNSNRVRFAVEGEELANSKKDTNSKENVLRHTILEAEKTVNTEPTEGQKEAGNYKKGHVKIDGFDVTIEQPKGSVRRGTDSDGKKWEQKINNTYGYIRGTKGVDGDHIDIFLSDTPDRGSVFIVDQVNKDGGFDEHKVMYGFENKDEATKAYLSNYEDGWRGLGNITEVSKDDFRKWIDSSHRKTKPFSEYKRFNDSKDLSTPQYNQAEESEYENFEEDIENVLMEPTTARRRSKSKSLLGRSLFDWNVEAESRSEQQAETARRAEEANAAIEHYSERFTHFMELADKIENQLKTTNDPTRKSALNRQLDVIGEMLDHHRDIIESSLSEYYGINNTPNDATMLAIQMANRIESEAKIMLNGRRMTLDLMDLGKVKLSDEPTEGSGEVKSAQGKIDYSGLGRLPDSERGEFAMAERLFTIKGDYNFTGGDKIHDRGDVAWLLRSMEDYSIEQSMAVLVDAEGRPKIVRLGVGTMNATQVDTMALRAAYDVFGAKQIYFVHNHPSGILNPSPQDMSLGKGIAEMFINEMTDGKIETVESLIIDTRSGRYTVFNGTDGSTQQYNRPIVGQEHPVETLAFDQSRQLDRKDGLPKANGSKQVADAIALLRAGQDEGVSYLLCSNSLEIVGYLHSDSAKSSDLDINALSAEMVKAALRFNANCVIPFGKNMDLNKAGAIMSAVKTISGGQVRMVDMVSVGQRESAFDLNLMEPGVNYDRQEPRQNYVADSSATADLSGLDDVRLPLATRMVLARVNIAAANSQNLEAIKSARNAIAGQLRGMLKAMNLQRGYDRQTAAALTSLAQAMLRGGLLQDATDNDVSRILSAVKNGVGKADISKSVDKLFEIVAANQLRYHKDVLKNLLASARKDDRTDSRGVKVLGVMDADGKRILNTFAENMKLSSTLIDVTMNEVAQLLGSPDSEVQRRARQDYRALQIAYSFAKRQEEITADEAGVKTDIASKRADKEAGTLSPRDYRQFKESADLKLATLRLERVTAFERVIDDLMGEVRSSVERANDWREQQADRIEKIHHMANSDMQGRSGSLYGNKPTPLARTLNGLSGTLTVPLRTFEQMMKMLGKNDVMGEGYLYNYFMQAYQTALDREWKGYSEGIAMLGRKASEVFGRNMQWADLYKDERKLPMITVKVLDYGGIRRPIKIRQGNAMYIYMVDKMADGRMKLRSMGIDETDVERIKRELDPRFVELADWLQEAFLPERRSRYNEVHRRMTGEDMDEIENYFPLRILKSALSNKPEEKGALSGHTTTTSAETTGAWKRRTHNNYALDIENANAFHVVVEHLKEMEHAAAFSELSRDLNDLRRYKPFELKVKNIKSIYGTGDKLWQRFEEVCSMVTGDYNPPVNEFDKNMMKAAKWVTAAKIAFRLFTAFKQTASFPAFLADASTGYFARCAANPKGSWDWCMKNLPNFEKRWKSRMAGDPILKKMENDPGGSWRALNSWLGRGGMAANAFVDALTVATGARAVYLTKYDRYKKLGYGESESHRRAVLDAERIYNQSQQSSESAFLSTLQNSGTWLSAMFTVFRNASMSYSRQVYSAARNIAKYFESDYKTKTIEFTTKQLIRDGIEPAAAAKEAHRRYNQTWAREGARLLVYGYIMPSMWYLMGHLPLLLLTDDDEERKKMITDDLTHGAFGPIEGLTAGDVMSEGLNLLLSDDPKWDRLKKDMPVTQDIENFVKKLGNDNIAALNDAINLFVQMGVGVNPQTLEDAVVGALDFIESGDKEDITEYALLLCRVANVPRSQSDKVFIEELGMTATEAQGLTPQELADRFARYKVMRDAPVGWLVRDDQEKESLMEKQRKKFFKEVKTRIPDKLDAEEEALLEETRTVAKQVEAYRKELEKQNREAYERGEYGRQDSILTAMSNFATSPEFKRSRVIKLLDRQLKRYTDQWVKAKSAQEKDSVVVQMRKVKTEAVKELEKITD